jgi:mycothiol synthase
MSQLTMRRPSLAGLPELSPPPPEYRLGEMRAGELEPVAALFRTAFEDESWTTERVHREFVAEAGVKKTFLISYAGTPVAAASALVPEKAPETGMLHWVAADPAHRGKRLGYLVSLAVLHEFVRHGCRDAALLTDDPRLPAIKTYLNLGFVPEHTDETHASRWETVYIRMAELAS